MPTLNDVLAGSQAQAVQVQQIIDALKGTPNKGVPVALVSLNDPSNYALTVQNDDPVNSRALSVLKADGTTLISADATGVTLGSPVNVSAGSLPGAGLANASVTNAKLGPDVARANLLTNGGFEVWQRGNGPFTSGSTISADRWVHLIAGTDTFSITRNTANVDASSLACAAVTFTLGTGAGASQYANGAHKQVDNFPVAGRTMTFSGRVNTATANAVRLGVTTDGAGGTTTYSSFHPGGGTYQTLSVTVTAPSNATLIQPAFFFAASCTAYLDNAMLVVGTQASDYVPMHPADDLARCLRYYEVQGDGSFWPQFAAYGAAGSTVSTPMIYKARKPVAPTITKVGTWTVTNCAQPTADWASQDGYALRTVVTATAAFSVNATSSAFITSEANP